MSSEIPDPIDNQQRVLVRQTATGFEQGIAAFAGFFTAGPLGALASWGTIRGVQGKWTPWFILGIPAALVINAINFGILVAVVSVTNQSSSTSDVQLPKSYLPPKKVTTHSSGGDSAQITFVEESNPPGLKIATGRLVYNDGDVLEGRFRVYCPTSQIRPIDYVLRAKDGVVKKSGEWWDESFSPKYGPEYQLISKTCD